ncbi:MAG: hypothetical protein ACOZF0_08260 [Thermodesulfobacteriota bacterium]
MKPAKSGLQLGELIKKAIADCEVTPKEYDEIMAMADSDGVIDEYERKLLQQFQDLIANQTIKRVRG